MCKLKKLSEFRKQLVDEKKISQSESDEIRNRADTIYWIGAIIGWLCGVGFGLFVAFASPYW